VPVLYFMQSVPNTMVREVFPSIFKDLGVSNLLIGTWVNIIALAWTFKLFWAPLVDLNFTKRLWVLAMQALCLVGFVALALGITVPGFFQVAIALLFAIAIASATHDVACDGLYLLSLSRQRQAAFIGVNSTCFRIGRLFCTGLLLWMAGWLQSQGYAKQTSYLITLGFLAGVYGLGWLNNLVNLPLAPKDTWASPADPGENRMNLLRTGVAVGIGVAAYFVVANALELTGLAIFQTINPTGTEKPVLPKWDMTPSERNWAIGLLVGCAIALPLLVGQARRLMRGTPMGEAFASYVRQSGFLAILFFIMSYRFGEAMVSTLAPLFLQDSPDVGGMSLNVGLVGQINGIAGVLGIILGGIAGGLFISRLGLRRAFWPLVICMHSPNLLYVWAAWARPEVPWLYFVAFMDNFGYGFGFAGYLVYLMWVAQRGNFHTSHYAIGTGLGALFIALAGIFAVNASA
jgi:PAT family beta-lactamase induction signal transducer AmpG